MSKPYWTTKVANTNLWAGLLLSAVGLLFILFLIPHGVVEPRKVKYAALSPSYYPRIVAIALCVLGLLVAVRGFLEHREIHEPDVMARPDAKGRIAVVFCILCLYAVSIGTVGFVLMSALVLAALTFLAGERRLWLIAANAVVLPFALYFFFVEVANIPIPAGVLKPLLVGS